MHVSLSDGMTMFCFFHVQNLPQLSVLCWKIGINPYSFCGKLQKWLAEAPRKFSVFALHASCLLSKDKSIITVLSWRSPNKKICMWNQSPIMWTYPPQMFFKSSRICHQCPVLCSGSDSLFPVIIFSVKCCWMLWLDFFPNVTYWLLATSIQPDLTFLSVSRYSYYYFVLFLCYSQVISCLTEVYPRIKGCMTKIDFFPWSLMFRQESCLFNSFGRFKVYTRKFKQKILCFKNCEVNEIYFFVSKKGDAPIAESLLL